jgi:prepilin-type N-terminal cleavage/methylation domain-containing protein/prepilin-type processing-associated H-X9-DG protein
MHRSKYVRAFTLIELLVVIAIIAILAAILFPVFAQARESARTSSCASNIKQINLALMQYVQDYDERYPMWQYGIPAGDPAYDKTDPFGGVYHNRNIGWDIVTQPYIKNKQVMWCPSVSSPGNDYDNNSKVDSDWTGSINYAINAELSGRGGDSWLSPRKLAAVNFPASTISLLEDGSQTSEGATMGLNGEEWGWTGDFKSNLYAEGATGDTSKAPLRRHKSGANYGFVDGHMKWYSAGSMGYETPRPSDAAMDSKLSKLMPRPADGNRPNLWVN